MMDGVCRGNSSNTPWRKWAWALAALIGIHLALALRWTEQGWVMCAGVSSGILLLMVFSLRISLHATGLKRYKWGLLSLTFFLWAVSFGIIFYGEYFLPRYPEDAWIDNFALAFRWLPMLLAVCRPEEENEPLSFIWLDFMQVVLIGVQLTLYMYPSLLGYGHHSWDTATWGQSEIYLNALSWFTLLVATARIWTIKRIETRPFYLSVCFMMVAYVVVRPLTSILLVQRMGIPMGSPVLLLGHLPTIAFLCGYFYVQSHNGPEHMPHYHEATSTVIRLASPVFFALAALLSGLATIAMGKHVYLGIVSSLLGLAFYALRSTIVQFRLVQFQKSLTDANLELEILSQRDPLTGIYNRRWFTEALAHEWRRAQRGRQPISVLLIDVDHFKKLNDTLGHKEGDLCLMKIAETLREELHRENDSLSRYGGEEFVAILPHTDHQGAASVAERMRSAVEGLGYSHPATEGGRVTISVGGCTHPSPQFGDPVDTLLLLSDEALYEAKRHGRNHVQMAVWPEESPSRTTEDGERAEPETYREVLLGKGKIR